MSRAGETFDEYFARTIPALPQGPDYSDPNQIPSPPPEELQSMDPRVFDVNPYEYDPVPPEPLPGERQIHNIKYISLSQDFFKTTPQFNIRSEEMRNLKPVSTTALHAPLGPITDDDIAQARAEMELRKNYYRDQKPLTSMELEYELEDTINSIVQCDKYYCPEIETMYHDAILLYASMHAPDKVKEFERCVQDQFEYYDNNEIDTDNPELWEQQNDPCIPRFKAFQVRYEPRVTQKVDEMRITTYNRPLIEYDGRDYNDPRWFWHVGTLWRLFQHQPYNNPYITIKACDELEKLTAQCMSKFTDEYAPGRCFRYWIQQKICTAGTNCPYLRPALFQCLDDTYLAEPNYSLAEKCIHTIPNYMGCVVDYVPLDLFKLGSQPDSIGDNIDGKVTDYADDTFNYSPAHYNNFNTYIPPLKHKPKEKKFKYHSKIEPSENDGDFDLKKIEEAINSGDFDKVPSARDILAPTRRKAQNVYELAQQIDGTIATSSEKM